MAVSGAAPEFAAAARALLALPRHELSQMGARARQCATRFHRPAVARLFLDQVGALCHRAPESHL